MATAEPIDKPTPDPEPEPTPEPEPEPEPQPEQAVHPGGAIMAGIGAPPPVDVGALAQRLAALESRVATIEQHASSGSRRKAD